MPHENGLPQTGEAQEIGQDADDCLNSNRPRSWKLTSLSPNDYGFDYQVQVTVGQQVTHPFRLQLKGSRSSAKNAAGTHFSIELKASTLRYYDNTDEPVLLVLCDLKVDLEEPRNCPLYFVWMPEELVRTKIENIPLDQEKVTVHIPVANTLTRDTDLLADIRKYHQLARIGRAFNIDDAHPGLSSTRQAEVLKTISENIKSRSVALTAALSEPTQDIWINPPKDSLAWLLTEARNNLDIGRTSKCNLFLTKAEGKLPLATPLESSEYFNIKGRLLNVSGETEQAATMFKHAVCISNQPKHWAAWAETVLRNRYTPGVPEDFSDVISELPDTTDPAILGIKARLLGASHKYDDAIAVCDSFDGPESLASRATLQTMFSKSEEALITCEEGLLHAGTKEATKRLFLVLRARARFTLALKDAEQPEKNESSSDDIIPPSGPVGTDPEKLRAAWVDIQLAADALEDIAWSSNAEFVMDILVATASMLGKQKEILPRVLAAAKSRPTLIDLQTSAEALAAQCGDFDAALEANSRIPDDDLKILRRVVFLHEAGKFKQSMELMESHLVNIERTHKLFGSALVLAALSAYEMARTDLTDNWRDILLCGPLEHRAHTAVLDFFLTKKKNRLSGDDALDALEKIDRELGHPQPTTILLFQEFEPSNPSHAERFLTVTSRLLQSIRIAPFIAIQKGIALLTLSRWTELIELCLEAENEFDTTDRLRAFHALALDRVGKTDEARSILESIIHSDEPDGFALQTYVNIMIRWGYADRAISATEKILEHAKSKAKKVDCIRLLFTLEQNSNPLRQRLVDLAFRMGELADQEDEGEEGVFLIMVMTATCFGDVTLSDTRQAEAKDRAEKYFKKFPNSSILKRVEYSQDASPAELLRLIKSTTGLNEERENNLAKLEAQLQNGELPVPYVWRPKYILSNVQDIAHLWELTKHSNADDKKYHLRMYGHQWNPLPARELKEKIPLLDITALFVLRDLDLLDELFDFFPRIAIAQETLSHLLHMTQLFSGSIWRGKCIELREKLKRHIGQIIQPQATIEEQKSHFRGNTQELEALAKMGRYLLYSDDIAFRIWCHGDDNEDKGMCTLDFLHALEETEVLTVQKVAEKLSILCKWHVGIIVLLRHQVALVPYEVTQARNTKAGVDILHESQSFMFIAGSIWDFRSDYLSGLRHVGSVLNELVKQAHVPTICISSFIGVWFLKKKLRTDYQIEPVTALSKVMLFSVANGSLDDKSTRRVWLVFLELVEFEHGDLMDEDKETEAYRHLAREAADIDHQMASKVSPTNTSFFNKLALGLTADTHPADTFKEAYTNQLAYKTMTEMNSDNLKM